MSTQSPIATSIRLAAFLNWSTFYYEILGDHSGAYHMARQAFEQAFAEMETLSREEYKDSTTLLLIIRDYVTFWEEQGDVKGIQLACLVTNL